MHTLKQTQIAIASAYTPKDNHVTPTQVQHTYQQVPSHSGWTW